MGLRLTVSSSQKEQGNRILEVEIFARKQLPFPEFVARKTLTSPQLFFLISLLWIQILIACFSGNHPHLKSQSKSVLSWLDRWRFACQSWTVHCCLSNRGKTVRLYQQPAYLAAWWLGPHSINWQASASSLFLPSSSRERMSQTLYHFFQAVLLWWWLGGASESSRSRFLS